MKKRMTPRTLRTRSVLRKRAKDHDLITFAALSRREGIPPINLTPILDRIHKDDMENGRPSLASIVVSAEKLTMPRRWADNWTHKDWMKERTRLYRYCRRTP